MTSFSKKILVEKIFSKRLTRTDVTKRLALRSRTVPHLPRFEGDLRALPLTVEDEEGREWVFRFRIREGKHKKPELSTGWLAFVRNKKLRIGDEIHFFKEKDEATGAIKYTIKAKTEFKLFGIVIGYFPYADQADR